MVKNLPACSIPGWGRSPGEGNGYPLQYSCLENPMDRGSGQATACGVRESQTRLSTDTHTHTHMHTLNTSKPQWPRASDICIFHSQGWVKFSLAPESKFSWDQSPPTAASVPCGRSTSGAKEAKRMGNFQRLRLKWVNIQNPLCPKVPKSGSGQDSSPASGQSWQVT